MLVMMMTIKNMHLRFYAIKSKKQLMVQAVALCLSKKVSRLTETHVQAVKYQRGLLFEMVTNAWPIILSVDSRGSILVFGTTFYLAVYTPSTFFFLLLSSLVSLHLLISFFQLSLVSPLRRRCRRIQRSATSQKG